LLLSFTFFEGAPFGPVDRLSINGLKALLAKPAPAVKVCYTGGNRNGAACFNGELGGTDSGKNQTF